MPHDPDILRARAVRDQVVVSLVNYGTGLPSPAVIAWAVSLVEATVVTGLVRRADREPLFLMEWEPDRRELVPLHGVAAVPFWDGLDAIDAMALLHRRTFGDVPYTLRSLFACLRRIVGGTVAVKLQEAIIRLDPPKGSDEEALFL